MIVDLLTDLDLRIDLHLQTGPGLATAAAGSEERVQRPLQADVCVVGAGAAGICLALELERLGKRVVLLEAGGREVEDEAQEAYRSEVVGGVHRGVHTGRFRALGGTTQRWGGQILELDAEDFERRAWVAGSGWPFGKAELMPFYERARAWEGVDRAIGSDGEVWSAVGRAMPEFEGLDAYFSRWCPEPNFARRHGAALAASSRVTVYLHANVVGMSVVDGVVRALQVRSPARHEVTVGAEQFVFCMGAIECVRFFLQPREGGLPWNRSGLLGRHFQDHIDANVAVVTPRDRGAFANAFDNVFLRGYKYHPKLRLAADAQRRAEVLNCAVTATFTSKADAEMEGVKATARRVLRGHWRELRATDLATAARHGPLLLRSGWRLARAHRVYNPPSAQVQLRVHCEQEPAGASSIGLSEERDSLGLLRTRLDWRISAMELRTVRYIAEVAARSLEGVAEVGPHAAVRAEGDDNLRASCDDSNHHMGGMRMAASAGEGVVDANLRLHGVPNAYVCSGAVFPSSGFSNPTHTVIALTMRLADRLARQ